MLDKLGKRKYALPFGIILVVACLFSLMFYPMMNTQMKDLPFAIVCLDEGVETSEGEVNLGELVAQKITETTAEDGDDAPIAWTRLSSQEELDQALANDEFYGALVIPADFSQHQYDTLVETMQTQMDEMGSSVTDGMDLPSGGLSFPAMSGSAANSASPQLSAEAQKMIAAAQGALAGAKTQAQNAADTFQQEQAAAVNAEKERASAQVRLDELQGTLDATKEQKSALEQQLSELKNKAAPTPEDQAQIAQITQQIADLDPAIATAESQVADAQAKLDSAAQAAEKAKQNASAAQGNLTTAQSNAKTAAVNAMGVSKTAAASSMLSTQAQALKGAIGTLKEKLGDLAGNFDLSDRLSDMGETVAAKALVSAAEKLEEGETDEAEDETGIDGSILVFVDFAKSPMVANTMQSTMQLMLAQIGFQAEIMMVHDGTSEGVTPESALAAAESDAADGEKAEEEDEESRSANPMANTMSMQILMIPAIMLSLIIGIVLTRIVRLADAASKKQRAQSLVKQLVLALVFSGLVALAAYCMYALVVGGEGDFGSMTLFMWVVSFALMVLAGGLSNIAFGLAVLAALCTIAFGMMTGILPDQALPAFWQDWVYPWAPQHYFGEGIRAVMYRGDSWWNAQSILFAWMALAGIVLSAVAIFLPKRGRAS